MCVKTGSSLRVERNVACCRVNFEDIVCTCTLKLSCISIFVYNTRIMCNRKHTPTFRSNPSKYGFTEKVIDGMRVDIRLIEVLFRDPNFQAKLEMADIIIQSTTPQWRPDNLHNTR